MGGGFENAGPAGFEAVIAVSVLQLDRGVRVLDSRIGPSRVRAHGGGCVQPRKLRDIGDSGSGEQLLGPPDRFKLL
jgi:hypothetical protein